jgi:hypothetical protein
MTARALAALAQYAVRTGTAFGLRAPAWQRAAAALTATRAVARGGPTDPARPSPRLHRRRSQARYRC